MASKKKGAVPSESESASAEPTESGSESGSESSSSESASNPLALWAKNKARGGKK